MDLREKEMGLEEYGEFLLRRRIVPEISARHYVKWVRMFLGWAADPKLTREERIEGFKEGLRGEGHWEDWQVEQAERAVKVYFHSFRDGKGLEARPVSRVDRDAAGRVDVQEVLAATRSLLRTKHYSYRTEQTYLGWIGQFLGYQGSIQKAEPQMEADGRKWGEGNSISNDQQPTGNVQGGMNRGAGTGPQMDADGRKWGGGNSISHDQQPTGNVQGGTRRVVVDGQGVKSFLTYLATRRKVAAGTQNQAFSALLFLCREVLRLEEVDLETGVRAKARKRLPVVLTVEETGRLLGAMKGTSGLMAEVLYGGGLRVMECCRLRVKDVDFDNDLLFVREGKGGKDRSTMLARSVKERLRSHLERVRALHAQDVAAGAGRRGCRTGWSGSSRTRGRSGGGSLCFRASSCRWIRAGGR